MQSISLADYLLLPFYLAVIYFVAFRFRNRHYPEGHPWRPYFIPGLTVKILGAIGISMLYCYVYRGGDTQLYFYSAQIINGSLTEHVDTWWRLITHTAQPDNIIDAQYVSQLWWYDARDTYVVCCISAGIGVFCFTKYLVIACICAVISFTGIWALFRTFALQYPRMVKQVAIATLFVPTVIMWGSGVFKDTFCMFAIGWLCYSNYVLLELRRIRISLLLMTLLSIVLLYVIKSYILFSFFPLLVAKSLFSIVKKQKRNRWLFGLVIALGLIYSARRVLAEGSTLLSRYSIENLGGIALHSKDWLLQVSEASDGSAYDLGDFEPTLQGIFSKFVPAVNVTLFRPYLWEARKPLLLLAAIESLIVVLITLYVLFKVKPFRIVKYTLQDPTLVMCIVFAIVFAFFTGVTTYNFGSLSRYKIPCIPFYILFLFILIDRKKADTKASVSIEKKVM